MRKFIILAVFAASVFICAPAHAAYFDFENVPFSTAIELEDAGITATFTNFSAIDTDNYLIEAAWDTRMDTLDAVINFSSDIKSYSFSNLILMNASLAFFNDGNQVLSTSLFDSIGFTKVSALPGVVSFDSVSVSPTPIPGAALLLASGLVGLVGLRRKFA